MYIEERQTKIISQLNSMGRIDVSELANIFQTSKETIRRDLNDLEKAGMLKRTHGGAILPNLPGELITSSPTSQTKSYNAPGETPVAERSFWHVAEKQAICKLAASYIEHEDTIFIDNSSTCIYLYQYIPADIQVTILTNSIQFLLECSKNLSPHHTIVCLGGIFKNTNLSIFGNTTIKNAQQYFPNKSFISCTGIISETQITDSGIQEIDIKKTLIKSSQEVFLLADYSKFKQIGPVYLGSFADIDYLITDSNSDMAYLNFSKITKTQILMA
ncbi:MAG: DeoR family transcriptional regulator [Herbinix sp.]|jgi:DeoR/GlpR family transcriptional regulator of sugar metabolism|nr:DeoR family transcriptional regulator [Herbinix sp.]